MRIHFPCRLIFCATLLLATFLVSFSVSAFQIGPLKVGGAGIMKTSEEVIKKYGLNYRLLPSCGPAMTAALKDAVNRHEWIVVTGWRPHWMFGRWKLRFLKQDPDKIVWEEGNIHIMGRKNLRKDKPELADFLSNMFFTKEQLSDLMVKVEESSDDVEVVARRWMNENPDVIDAWIPKEK